VNLSVPTPTLAMPIPMPDRRGVAAMEFALIAPAMLLMIWGVYDLSRALLAWEETVHAAQAIAQAAEKLSITPSNYPGGQPITALTATQMQTAMSSIYAEMPWLNLGDSTGTFKGNFTVTLSGVAFMPLCPALNAKNGLCVFPQVPTVLWSSYLTEGGSQLLTPPPPPNNTALYRLCGALLPVPQFPNNNTQRLFMMDPDLVPNGANNKLVLPPQVVADVQYTFTPTFPLLAGKTYTFYASASFPAPVGDNDQEIVFDKSDSLANVVEDCQGGGSI
jgi:Flp pilus assembly protein TadG